MSNINHTIINNGNGNDDANMVRPTIKVATVVIGKARTEGRAASHDGEYLTVIRLADGSWVATGNGGITTGDMGDWYEGTEEWPGFDELAEAAEKADDDWDFYANPDQYGFEARDWVRESLAAK